MANRLLPAKTRRRRERYVDLLSSRNPRNCYLSKRRSTFPRGGNSGQQNAKQDDEAGFTNNAGHAGGAFVNLLDELKRGNERGRARRRKAGPLAFRAGRPEAERVIRQLDRPLQ